jgi:hypothetical protein
MVFPDRNDGRAQKSSSSCLSYQTSSADHVFQPALSLAEFGRDRRVGGVESKRRK